jgi:hypothetical protein
VPVLLVTFIFTELKQVGLIRSISASCTFLLLRQFLGICSLRVPAWFSASTGRQGGRQEGKQAVS